MKLSQIISRKAILPNIKAANKKGVVQELVTVLKKSASGENFSVTEIVNAIMTR